MKLEEAAAYEFAGDLPRHSTRTRIPRGVAPAELHTIGASPGKGTLTATSTSLAAGYAGLDPLKHSSLNWSSQGANQLCHTAVAASAQGMGGRLPVAQPRCAGRPRRSAQRDPGALRQSGTAKFAQVQTAVHPGGFSTQAIRIFFFRKKTRHSCGNRTGDLRLLRRAAFPLAQSTEVDFRASPL